MPRININEKDRTAPGISSDYANFAVLITGFEGASPAEGEKVHAKSKRLPEKDRPVEPDSNGVYEFVTASDFEETIGLCAPHVIYSKNGGDIDTYNYGNQMAYELLNLGYSVVYKPIKSQDELTKAKTWEIFKDKVSYDFRFISHGLLSSDGKLINRPEYRKLIAAKKKLIAIADEVFCTSGYNSYFCPNYKAALKLATAVGENFSYLDYDASRHDSKELYPESTVMNATITNSAGESVEYSAKAIIKEKMNLPKVTKAYTAEQRAADQEAWWGLLETKLAEAYEAILENSANYVSISDLQFCEYIKENLQLNAEDGSTTLRSFAEYWTMLGEAIATARSSVNEVTTVETINEANRLIANLAAYKSAKLTTGNEDEPAADAGRGDCIALIELDENAYVNSVSVKEPEILIAEAISKIDMTDETGPYCALTVPSVFYTSLENDAETSVWQGNNKMPGAFHYLACFIRSLGQGYAEWYAAAGYTRGVSNLIVDHTSVKLGEIAINVLEPRNNAGGLKFACNVIANFRGSYYLWGNRTAYPLGDANGDRGDLVASHFLNIRQLCTTIKKKLFVACRKFTFDPNSDTLWINFCNAIKPTLELMKADQGIRDYRIMKVATDKKATLKAKIRIIPIEAVEDFILEVSLEDSFGETTAAIIG